MDVILLCDYMLLVQASLSVQGLDCWRHWQGKAETFQCWIGGNLSVDFATDDAPQVKHSSLLLVLLLYAVWVALCWMP